MNKNGWTRGFQVALGCLAALLLIWGAVALNGALASDNNKVDETPSATPTDVPTDEVTDPVDCPAGFVQKVIYDPELNRFIKGGIDAPTAIESRDKLLKAVKHDASSLLFYARLFGVKSLPSETEALTADGTCLSEAGRQVHHDLTVVLNASSTSFGEAPSNAYNSGVNNEGLPVIDTAPGISGNKKALKVKLPDGTRAIILVRCGNPVFATPPSGIPPGPTDNQPPTTPPTSPPTTPPTTPPTPTCPPGTTGTPPNCLEIKDPQEDPAPQGNAPEGGGQNQDPGPGQPNPSPTFPSDPHTNPPPPPPPPPTTPPPTQPPEGGGGGGEDNPPGDPGAP